MVDEARREQIRSRVDEKRNVAARLRDKVSDDYLKAQARLAWHWLDDVEQIFLNNVDENRTPAAEARWLDYAEMSFGIALQRLQAVEKVMETYGPNAISVG